jgi:hypothetical protein
MMKIILIAVSCLVLLMLGILLVGSLLPRRHSASRSAAYQATPEQLYALISGAQNWRPDVVHFETVTGEQGRELQKETARNGQTIAYEISDRVPPHELKRRIASPDLPYSGTWTYSVQPRDGMTVVRITEEGEVGNPIFRFVSRFVLGYTHTMDQYLSALGNATGQKDIAITN